jgi:hypothetical protein
MEPATFRLVAQCLNQLRYLFNYITITLNQHSRVLLEKHTVSKTVNNFWASFGFRRFITTFTPVPILRKIGLTPTCLKVKVNQSH